MVSLTYSGNYTAYGFGIESVDGLVKKAVKFPPTALVFPFTLSLPPPDFSNKEIEGNVYVFELPSGSYLIKGIGASYNMGVRQGSIGPRAPLNLPFPIQSGKLTYLGNVYIDLKNKAENGARPNFKLVDEAQRDFQVMQKNFPALRNSKIDISIPKGFRLDYLGTSLAPPERFPHFE